jgi:hypothetical protein
MFPASPLPERYAARSLTTCSDVAALGPISPITSCACQRMGRRVIKSCTSVYEYDGSMADGRRGPAGTHLVGADGDVGAVKEVRGSTALTLHGSSPVIVCPPSPTASCRHPPFFLVPARCRRRHRYLLAAPGADGASGVARLVTAT